jgi:hypothetical protein
MEFLRGFVFGSHLTTKTPNHIICLSDIMKTASLGLLEVIVVRAYAGGR